MSYKPHTPEWLAAARKQAGLSMAKLAELAGVHVNTVQYAERRNYITTPNIWAKLDAALYPIVPVYFVNEDRLIADAQAYAHLRGEDASCRLCYVLGRDGIVFVDVRPIEEDVSSQFVVASWEAALNLLTAQKGLLG